jgi:hypothetical protein
LPADPAQDAWPGAGFLDRPAKHGGFHVKYQFVQNVITGDREIYAELVGRWYMIGNVPKTKWKSVSLMRSAFDEICEKHSDWSTIRSECQGLIDAAPAVPSGDISAQVFDPLKLMRDGSPIGDALARAAHGDHSAIREFPRVVARDQMIRAVGSHIVRFTSVIGEGLGSGIVILLPAKRWGILTCSHVWAHLTKHDRIQIYCAATMDGFGLNQRMIDVPMDSLWFLDMAESEFMEQAGVDSLLFRRDSAILAGDIGGMLPIGARAFDLRGVSQLEPKEERYALVGNPFGVDGGAQSAVSRSRGLGKESSRVRQASE